MNTILCPHCKKPVEISEAFTAQLEQEIRSREHEKHQADLTAVKKKTEELAFKKAAEEMDLALKDKENEAIEARERTKKLQEEMLGITKLNRELKIKDEERERELEKKLDERSEEIRAKAQTKAEEEQYLKIKELEKQRADALKEVEDMRRKLQQGSQQLQGEAFEAEFETQLLQHYPNDKILPVTKGVRGGDVVQEV